MDNIETLRNCLCKVGTHQERISILDRLPSVQKLTSIPSFFSSFLQGVNPESECALKQLAFLGQILDPHIESIERWKELVGAILLIDRFYWEIGGIVGYQAEVLSQIKKNIPSEELLFHPPVFDDISSESREVKEAIFQGLKSMPLLAELYPLGGSADRLHLVDEINGHELPAAKLHFAGRPLLETLIRDLEAREWLYFRLFGTQIITPIAIMSSMEKQNYNHVLKLCEDHLWFGRPRDRFQFFVQPLVPAVDGEGNWYKAGPLKPVLKPGGHGAIWKLANDHGIFSWLADLNCEKALIRQINNPIAGLDYGLVAFNGIGCSRNMTFGFASCSRLVNAAEGMIVLVEKKSGEIVLSNIEYCDFAKFGIEDTPRVPGEPYSQFSSNSNILFVDLKEVQRAVKSNPFPGLLMNLKMTQVADEFGGKKQALLGRLESTMQNIADVFTEQKTTQLGLKTEKTFAIHNARHKTISVAKKAYEKGLSMRETPELCFHELLFAARELLALCGFTLPEDRSAEESMIHGPSFVFLYHGAIGPFYSIIKQKIRGGTLNLGSELILEIAELNLENLELDGSLQILADQKTGEFNNEGAVQFSHRIGRAILRDVKVRNRGVDWGKSSPFWKMNLYRTESVKIELQGWSEFDAQGVVFEGNHHFIVKNGRKMVVRQVNGKLEVKEYPIEKQFLWTYVWEDGVRLYPA